MKTLFRLYFVLTAMISFSGCDESVKNAVEKQLIEVNQVKIYVFDEGKETISNTENVITIKNQDSVNMLKESISDLPADFYKCGYSGAIEFFKNNESISNMSFNIMPDCNHIVFRVKDRMISRKLTEQGIILLKNYCKK
ncbi:MAG TPA: hypothetical protein PLG90_03655 [Ignavibacteria bacterium]|nr:hypothetical protein [Ignavibacteria bacterium]